MTIAKTQVQLFLVPRGGKDRRRAVVTLEVDQGAILESLAPKAAYNRSRRSRAMHGAVTVEVIFPDERQFPPQGGAS